MWEAIINDDENFERALRRFGKPCEKAGILSDLRDIVTARSQVSDESGSRGRCTGGGGRGRRHG